MHEKLFNNGNAQSPLPVFPTTRYFPPSSERTVNSASPLIALLALAAKSYAPALL